MAKTLGKTFRRFLARVSLQFWLWIIKHLGLNCVYGLAKIISFLGYYLAVRQRRIAKEALDIAYQDELNYAQKKVIIKSCFEVMTKGALELLYLMDKPYLIPECVKIEGKEYLDKAISEGKGVIGISAHFGNFPLMLMYLSCIGYKTNAVIRPMRDEKVNEILEKKRLHCGIHTIYSKPPNACVQSCLKALENKELLFLQLDQNFGTGGIFVNFFKRKAATAKGPVVFALRTQAPILPIFIIRNEDNTHKIIVEPPAALEIGKTQEETILLNIQKITDIIESYIRRYPSHWGWIHRRWKSRPNHKNTK